VIARGDPCPVPRAKTEAMTKRHETTLRAYDGLRLAATLVEPGRATSRAVVLVHGGGVTREEGGVLHAAG
jgi:hypothetical protein